MAYYHVVWLADVVLVLKRMRQIMVDVGRGSGEGEYLIWSAGSGQYVVGYLIGYPETNALHA